LPGQIYIFLAVYLEILLLQKTSKEEVIPTTSLDVLKLLPARYDFREKYTKEWIYD